MYHLEVSKRIVGENIPVSVGTASVLKTLADTPDDKKPSYLYFSIRTLFRNLYSAIETSLRKKVTELDFIPTLLEEIKFIFDYVGTNTKGKTKAIFFLCSYKGLEKLYPHANLKKPTTELQKFYDVLETNVYTILKKELSSDNTMPILYTDTIINGGGSYSWIMSHYPIDLLNVDSFKQLGLVESYTGTIKYKSQWTSKLTGLKDSKRIPFNMFTLQVFGDGVLFNAMKLEYKRTVLELSELSKWTASITTLSSIRQSINVYVKDNEMKKYLLSLF